MTRHPTLAGLFVALLAAVPAARGQATRPSHDAAAAAGIARRRRRPVPPAASRRGLRVFTAGHSFHVPIGRHPGPDGQVGRARPSTGWSARR